MTSARIITVSAMVACGLVTACGSAATPSASSSQTTASASASATAGASAVAGTAITTAKFGTVVPQGWTNKIDVATEVQKFSANGQVLFLVEQGPPGQQQSNVNDIMANVNVLLLTTPVPDNQVPKYLGSVSSSGATNLSSPQAFTLDGATGQYIVYDRDVSGTPGESQDMIVNHGGSTYDIVLNTSQFAFNQQLTGLQSVLAAWKWTS